MRGLVGVLFSLALVYGIIVAVAYTFQRALIYVPDSRVGTPARAGVSEMAVVHYPTEDNLTLKAWYKKAPAGRPTILYLHGNAGNISGRGYKARTFMDAGYGVLLVEYRGYGGNPGSPTEQGLHADARAAAAFLEREGVTPDKLVIYGASLGSGVASRLAVEHPPAALILEAPFTSIVDVARRIYFFLPVDLLTKDRFDSESRIAHLKSPLLIIHGDLDTTVPSSLGKRLLDAAVEPKKGIFFPHASHNDLFDHGGDKAVLEWLAGLFSTAPS